MLVNSRKQLSVKYNVSGSYMEVDIFIPKYNLCFEFQDSYHYVTTWYCQRTRESIELRQLGKTLFTIPCWWDGQLESLLSTIYLQRPDVVIAPIINSPIPLNPPENYFLSIDIPDVGELMLASFPLDVKLDNEILNNMWWMGEKYDGVRCCWHPTLNTLKAKTILLPQSFQKWMPNIFIDGELSFGRGQFLHTYSVIKESENLNAWDSLRIAAFDDPSIEKNFVSFELRYPILLSNISPTHPFLNVVFRTRCEGELHLKKFVEGILGDKGEGLILRKIGSFYEHGRNRSLVKMKAAFADQEGVVSGFSDDGTQIKLPNGNTLVVPPQSVHVANLQLGDVITFSHENHARRELPVNPKIYRIRTDVTWEDVVHNFHKDQKFLNDSSIVGDFTQQPMRHWTAKNMRLFLENFAKSRGMNPLMPQTWYATSYHVIRQQKGITAILAKFKGGYLQMIQSLFPEIGIDEDLYRRYSWKDIKVRRRLFEQYAKRHGFDPLVAENWYTQTREKILSVRGAIRAVGYHNQSISQALIDLFPNIGLDKKKFTGKSLWREEINRRKFFEVYARDNGFDPLDPENWYSQNKEDILETKGAKRVLLFHEGRITKALIDLFPEIGLVRSRFYLPYPYSDPRTRKRYFESFARDAGFDPLVPDNWYSQSYDSILSRKDINKVIAYHDHSIKKAIMTLFPAIGLQKQKFKWFKAKKQTIAEIRSFFEGYAKESGFDPLIPQNWYSQLFSKILAFRRGSMIKVHYQKRVSLALLDAFPEIGFEKMKLQHTYEKS